MQAECTTWTPLPEEGVAHIPLRRHDGSIRAYAIVDAAVATWVNQWRWCLVNGYAARSIYEGGVRTATVYLHRELLKLPRVADGREGDHIDRDRLNDRDTNLRVVPKRAQQHNMKARSDSASGLRGVSLKGGRWVAAVKTQGRKYHLGSYDTKEAAVEAAQRGRSEVLQYAID